jgi:putative hemolysin
MIIYIFVIALLVMMSAVYSSTEIALLALSRSEQDRLKTTHFVYRKILIKWQYYPSSIVSINTIANNMVNIAASVLAGSAVKQVLEETTYQGYSEVLSIAILTFVVIIYGEIVPKTIAKNYPKAVAMLTLPVLFVSYYLFFVFSKILTPISGLILFLFRINIWKRDENKLDKDEIEALIDYGKEDGALAEMERQIAKKTIRLQEIKTKSIMTHRMEIISISLDASFDEVIKTFQKSGRSKLPVFDGKKDNIVGVLFIKDIFVHKKKSDFQVKKYIKNAVFVPELIHIPALIRTFRKEEVHLVLVVDEYGSLSGLVTLEDITYEIFGEFEDKYD